MLWKILSSSLQDAVRKKGGFLDFHVILGGLRVNGFKVTFTGRFLVSSHVNFSLTK